MKLRELAQELQIARQTLRRNLEAKGAVVAFERVGRYNIAIVSDADAEMARQMFSGRTVRKISGEPCVADCSDCPAVDKRSNTCYATISPRYWWKKQGGCQIRKDILRHEQEGLPYKWVLAMTERKQGGAS